jgi:F0F1-type ATP synthase membrane subunit c/vacuolar-type H+-ATPase subunit K
MKKIIFIVVVMSLCFTPLFAAETTAGSVEFDSNLESVQRGTQEATLSVSNLAKGIMIGLAVSGAATGIGVLASSAFESIARQPEASPEITAAMNTGIYACVGLAVGTFAISFFF